MKEVEDKAIEDLQTSAATSFVKTLQMVRLHKVIFAVGIFSVFEALLQDRLNCNNGFTEAKYILRQAGETTLLEQFSNIELAVNTLKHGQGRSYNAIIAKNGGTLTAQVKRHSENFFNKGDVSEVSSLIDVDDKFIEGCVDVIEKVSKVIQHNRPEVYL
ncbi:hypothetical protein MD537_00765 [Flavihumibacter sediminis]|nr:hypothetical protein [Flavihumibacter sediminis]